jgi:hypothetical protein
MLKIHRLVELPAKVDAKGKIGDIYICPAYGF